MPFKYDITVQLPVFRRVNTDTTEARVQSFSIFTDNTKDAQPPKVQVVLAHGTRDDKDVFVFVTLREYNFEGPDADLFLKVASGSNNSLMDAIETATYAVLQSHGNLPPGTVEAAVDAAAADAAAIANEVENP